MEEIRQRNREFVQSDRGTAERLFEEIRGLQEKMGSSF
ncbi:hypothetical protein LEP1GSC016_0804 [Leptospira borgpetersenii serovar Hardjo-bovis str. Sponselee]|uniref:Uncharacterized protein n=1 Tax=Leptospira borgpetersenii serovar Hardjo-bovis str. Sponselee TaxID=1303729 RepID=M6BYL0_LEPBO|nr:hypothetical protein LEP1GSC016_0804 [Leptospira borgpetersenii serovar Hardjo-bovis str. Sponselee]